MILYKRLTMTVGVTAYFIVDIVAVAVVPVLRRPGVVATSVPSPEADAARGAAGAPD